MYRVLHISPSQLIHCILFLSTPFQPANLIFHCLRFFGYTKCFHAWCFCYFFSDLMCIQCMKWMNLHKVDNQHHFVKNQFYYKLMTAHKIQLGMWNDNDNDECQMSYERTAFSPRLNCLSSRSQNNTDFRSSMSLIYKITK